MERAPEDRRKCAGTLAGRPTQELAGDQPRNGGRQPKNWTGKPLFFFKTAGTFVFILDFSGFVSEVARGRGTYVGGSVGLVYHVPIVLSLALVL